MVTLKRRVKRCAFKNFILFSRDDKVGGIMATWKRVAIYLWSRKFVQAAVTG